MGFHRAVIWVGFLTVPPFAPFSERGADRGAGSRRLEADTDGAVQNP